MGKKVTKLASAADLPLRDTAKIWIIGRMHRIEMPISSARLI
jgi:hypothetical protein